jgi:hypothetical protein
MRPAKGTQQCEREDEQEHKQNHMDVHEAFSRLKMSRGDRFLLRSKNKDCLERLSSGLGKKDELSTTNNGSTPASGHTTQYMMTVVPLLV